MSASPSRHDLLASRLRAFTRTLPHLKGGQARSTARAWAASRRLRELLPILQLDGPTVERLGPRLRKVTRKLGAVVQADALPGVLDEAEKNERRGRQSIERVREDVRRMAEKARTDLFRRKVGNDVRRVAQKLTATVQLLHDQPDTKTQVRDMQWAAKARVARCAGDLKSCVNAAGSVYLPGRLQEVRVATRKLMFAAELVADVAASVPVSDVRKLSSMERLLSQLDDRQALIDRIRHVQGSLATPDLKAWKDLDRIVMLVETRCRALHARYMRERPSLLALCDRLAARAPVDGGTKRKVS